MYHLYQTTMFYVTVYVTLCLWLDEPVYNSSQYRRKSVFAEAYNPEDDDGDDTKVTLGQVVAPYKAEFS